MKIVVKSKETNFTLYIPMFILTSGIKLTSYISTKYHKHNNSDKDLQNFIKYIDYIDMESIMLGMKELKKHKGLILVEINANDGDYVLVRV
ncbi:hypothetical protein GNF77_15100 [Clostridium perfringens]|uniref:Uncharacterized protein n=1 Tax=Clostridium perfringens TaxID=1502 RepID=A0AAW9IPW5_CLOPF|nr:hypothetical protein [Clostridium perfringens]MDZ5010210.1 hypothetical protein [Clostridium perfringens]